MKINELHDKLFDVLCVIDDICKKENVRYFLDGGTELGAVREHDFIPWDDDLDIKVLAEDYPAFKAAMEKHLPEHMHLAEPDILAPGFYDFIVRIYDDRWLIRRETDEDRYYGNYQNRVGTDVFILSYSHHKTLNYIWTRVLYGLGMGHRYRLDYKKYTPAEKCVVFILSNCGKLVSVPWLWRMFWRAVNRWNRHPSQWRLRVGSPDIGSIQSRIFDTTTSAAIRGRDFPIPGGYDEELTCLYGDYMTPRRGDEFIQHLDLEDRLP